MGTYVIEPGWANWVVTLEMFVAGVAAGTFFFMALANVLGDDEDKEVAGRLGFLPGPLIVLAAILLTVDLGQPGRFLNLVFTSPAAAERSGPFMLNPNSPMNYGTYLLFAFGLFCIAPFFDALRHTGRRWVPELVHSLSHNVIHSEVGGLLALGVGAYSGVLVNVTNQGIWADTYLLGGLYVVFSALSGFAVAGIAADLMDRSRTEGAVRSGLLGTAAIAGVLLALFVGNLYALGAAEPLIAVTTALVAPIFWVGVVGLAILYPLVVVGTGARLRVGRVGISQLTVVGAVVLLGVLAFRWSLLHSALVAVGGQG